MTTSAKNGFFALVFSLLGFLITSIPIHANTAQPKFTIIPQSLSTVTVGATGTGHITYIVTNKLPARQTLTMTPINGITQLTTGANVCQSPMVLNPGASCFLILSINGGQFPADKTTTIAARPQICIGTNQLSCSQPSTADWLKVNIVTASVTIGGTTITGLTSSGLILKNAINGETFNVSANPNTPLTYFTVPINSNYEITIAAHPAGLTCSLSNPIGRAQTNVTNVDIICSAITVTIGGTVTGLPGASTITLKNGGSSKSVSNSATSQVYFSVPINSPYDVTILASSVPVGYVCNITPPTSGTAYANVTNMNITCDSINVTIGGTVTGLPAASTITLKNGGNAKDVSNSATSQVYFSVPINSPYDVTILASSVPVGYVCNITPPTSGTAYANVTNMNITCDSINVTIGGTVTGLPAASTITLKNGGSSKSVSNSATSQVYFSVPINSPYDVTILASSLPVGYVCTISPPTSGTASVSVTNMDITCDTTIVTIGGTVAGLASTSTITLQNNGNTKSVANSATPQVYFSVPSNSPYDVTILASSVPPGYICTITPPTSGTATTNITSMDITCACSATYTITIVPNGLRVTPPGPTSVGCGGSQDFLVDIRDCQFPSTPGTTCPGSLNLSTFIFTAGPIYANCTVVFVCSG
jgi:hypothetical protein